ncbi:MAG: sporulation protein Cse60 [Bacteroidales bacterium]|nr:sporulation protein Cse60 [Bacteroidales bacterium]
MYSAEGTIYKANEKLETLVNDFISGNDIDVVDIKYSTAMTENSCPHYVNSAMIVYNTK